MTGDPVTPGLLVAPLTPFTPELKIDEAKLQRQIDYIIQDCGATIVVAAGVETQEYTYLGFEERKALIRHTIECVRGRVPVMAGVSHPSFKAAIELAHDAEKYGAEGIQLLAKDYERAAHAQLHFALFPSKWMHRGLAPTMKAAMNLIGIPAGNPYPPYASLTDEEQEALAEVLANTVLRHRLARNPAGQERRRSG